MAPEQAAVEARRVEATGGPRALATASVLAACVLLPLCMTVANKSPPLLLAVAAVLANLGAVAAGRGADLLRRYGRLARGPSGLIVVAGIALAVASVAWSTDRAVTLRGLREALPEVVFAWSFAAAGSCVFRRSDARVLPYGLLAAAAAIVFEASLGMPLHHLVGARAEPYDLKWSALTLALLLWPAIGADLDRGSFTRAGAVMAAVAVAAMFAHSSTALCAVVISAVCYAASRAAPRFMPRAFGLVLFAALIAAPWLGQIAGAVMTPDLRGRLEQQHAEHRIEIWTQFGQRVGERIWFGHGFNASFGIGRRDNPAEAAIINSHPHNIFLQVWIEFGLVGAAGLTVAVAYLLRGLRQRSVPERAVRIAQVVTMMVLGLVWQNPWRPWWLAAVGLAMALLLIERLDREGESPEGRAVRGFHSPGADSA